MARLVLALPLLAALAGCAERWARPGASEAQADAANEACRARAAEAVPPAMQWRIVEPARLERDRHCWTAPDGRTSCRVLERWRPPRWDYVDVNLHAREAWRRQCMVDQGFTFQGYRPLRLQ